MSQQALTPQTVNYAILAVDAQTKTRILQTMGYIYPPSEEEFIFFRKWIEDNNILQEPFILVIATQEIVEKIRNPANVISYEEASIKN